MANLKTSLNYWGCLLSAHGTSAVGKRMWNRQLILEPEMALFGQQIAARDNTVGCRDLVLSLIGSGCEATRITNIPDLLRADEVQGVGVIFSDPLSNDLCGIIMSARVAQSAAEDNPEVTPLESIAGVAHDILGDMPNGLGFETLSEPMLVFDMTATILASVAVMAGSTRHYGVMAYSLFGQSGSVDLARFCVLSKERLQGAAGLPNLEAA